MKAEKMILKDDEQAIFALRSLFQQYGYLPYKMSRFEEYDLYVRNKDFLVSEQIITFADRSGKLLALKPDVTLSIIKNSPDTPGVVQKLYYNENVYRADNSSHTIKEIPQTGLECVGDLGSYEIAEVALLAAKSLELLGDTFVLDISHMGFISAVMDACGVAAEVREEVLRCLHQKNGHELADICQGLAEANRNKLQILLRTSGTAARVRQEIAPLLITDAEKEAFKELCDICAILEASGYAQSVQVDFSVGNNMKYYSGIVFKGYLAEIPTSILSGGQYDKLPRRMGRKSRAIGFALYLDLLERKGSNGANFDVDTLILYDDTVSPARLIAAAQKAAQNGSVLVSTAKPKERSWKNLIELTQGEAAACENNG